MHSALESDLAGSDIAVGFLEVASADEGLSSVEGAVWVDLLVGHTQAEAIQGPPPPHHVFAMMQTKAQAVTFGAQLEVPFAS